MLKSMGAFAAILLIVSSIAADCDDDPDNLLAGINCAFDLGIEHWSALNGQLSHETTDGFPTPGSAYAYANAPADLFAMVNSTCLLIPPSKNYWFGAWAHLEPTSDSSTRCEVRFQVYDNSGCSGGVTSMPSSSWVGMEMGTWISVDGGFTSELVQQWGQLYAICTADASEFAVLIDDFFLVEDPRIFLDGFEDGSCYDWSVCPTGGPL